MAIDATVGGATANSYVTLAEAASYFAGRLGTACWDGLSGTDREKALVQATREIDRHRFHGFKQAPAVQALQFPRAWPYNADDPAMTTRVEVPLAVKQAQCEQALWLAQNLARGGQSQREQLQVQGVASAGFGDLREDFTDAARSFVPRLSPVSRQLLGRWIDRTARLVSPGREQMAEVWGAFVGGDS